MLKRPSSSDSPAQRTLESANADAARISLAQRGLLAGAWAILKKDLAYELQNRETLVVLTVFSLVVVFIFSFAFDLAEAEAKRLLPGLLWMTILFASVLGFSKSMAFERRGDALSGLLLAPIPKEAIFLGKVMSSLLFLLASELVLLPLFFAFFSIKASFTQMGLLVLVLLLGSVGLAVVGSFLAAICQVSRQGEILFSLGYFPLVIPILIAGTTLSKSVLETSQIPPGPWLNVLIAFDLIYAVVCLWVFEYVVED